MSNQLHARKKPVGSGNLGSFDATEDPSNKGKLKGAAQTIPASIGTLAIALFLFYSLWRPRAEATQDNIPSVPRFGTSSGHSYVTVVMPSVVNPSGRSTRLDTIASTWGPLSHAIFVLHNVSEFQQAPHLALNVQTFPQTLLVPPEISVHDGLNRMNHVIRTVFQQVNPDFAFFVNDHTYVISDHVCSYLHDKSPDQHMYEGHALKNENDAFNSGAAGYFLSRMTMQGLVQKWDEGNAECLAKSNGKSNWLQGNPGLVTATCLAKEMGVNTVDTRDKGSHRFHAFGLVGTVAGKVDEWYINKHDNLKDIAGFDDSYAIVPAGEHCCSKETISFHYVEYSEAKALFHVRQELLDRPSITDAELKEIVIKEWPKDWKLLGGYSKPLPKDEDQTSWAALITVLRNISSRMRVAC